MAPSKQCAAQNTKAERGEKAILRANFMHLQKKKCPRPAGKNQIYKKNKPMREGQNLKAMRLNGGFCYRCKLNLSLAAQMDMAALLVRSIKKEPIQKVT